MMTTGPLLRSLALGAIALGVTAGPADAFCVRNASKVPIELRLQSLNPLAGFRKVLKTGARTCCDWLYRRCNPTAARNARLTLSIRGYGGQYRDYYCSGPIFRRTMAVSDGEITVFDDPTTLGALRCDSRDFFRRDVQAPRPAVPVRPRTRTRPATR